MHEMLFQTGVTTDRKPVIGGTFAFYETHGIPFSVICLNFMDKGWMPDWIHFYKCASDSGMKHDRIMSMINEAVVDSFGVSFSKVVKDNLNKIYEFAVHFIKNQPDYQNGDEEHSKVIGFVIDQTFFLKSK